MNSFLFLYIQNPTTGKEKISSDIDAVPVCRRCIKEIVTISNRGQP